MLRRFRPRDSYHLGAEGTVRQALVVDVETTGIDPRADRIIEFAAVPFTYVAETGQVVAVQTALGGLEDPGRPIPPEVTEITGINDDMVRGHRLDEAALVSAMTGAQLVIAHNAAFDRKFVERRLPAARGQRWACSHREVPWHRLGRGSRSLEYLLIEHAGIFFDGHRAEIDCRALIHLLAEPVTSGEIPLRLLLESARKRSARIWALGAPFESKDLLKGRGYRWSGGEEGRPKAWHTEVAFDEQEAEFAWLRQQVYGGRDGGWKVDLLDAKTRYAE